MDNLISSHKMDLEEYKLQFIVAVRGLMRQDHEYLPSRGGSWGNLIKKMEAILVDSEMRKPVLRAITGLSITSQKQLTWHTHTTLIEEIERGGEDVATIIRSIEFDCQRYAENKTDKRTESIYAERLLS